MEVSLRRLDREDPRKTLLEYLKSADGMVEGRWCQFSPDDGVPKKIVFDPGSSPE